MFCSFTAEDNVCDVCEAVMEVSAKYYKLGIVFGLPPSELDKIWQGFPHDMDQALIEVIKRWLKHSYKVDQHGPPSWRKLVEAVDSRVGGDNHLLAKKIASHHPLGMTFSANMIKLFVKSYMVQCVFNYWKNSSMYC